MNKEFAANINGILERIEEKLQLLTNITVSLTEKEEKLNELLLQLNGQIEKQQRIFQDEQEKFAKQADAFMINNQEKMDLLAKKMVEQLEAGIDSLETSQNRAHDKLIESLNTFAEKQAKAWEQSNLYQQESFAHLENRIEQMETSLLKAIDPQVLLEKLESLEKDLAYQRLPFYKKWFTKREDF